MKETAEVDTPEVSSLEREIVSASPELHEAVSLAAEAGFTTGQLIAYDKQWDANRSERTLIGGKAEEVQAEGESVGLEKGRADGLAEGRDLER